MTFQSTVNFQQAAGIPGEMAFEGPTLAKPGMLVSTSAANNKVGNPAFITSGATGSWAAGGTGIDPSPLFVSADPGGNTSVFAGQIANPKTYASIGTQAGGSLAPTLILPNNTLVELVTEGDFFATMPAASNPGDVVFAKTDGSGWVTTAPGVARPALSVGPVGTIKLYVDAAASLAVVHFEPIVFQVA